MAVFQLLLRRSWIQRWFSKLRSIMILSRVFPKNRDPKLQAQESRLISILRQSKMISDSVELVWNWNLFLTHPTCWNKCMTSKNAQCSSRSGFRILKISCRIGVLKQSQSAVFSWVTNKTILFLFTCMLNVRNQSIQAFVTSFGPFCYGSCEFFYWP